MAVHVKIDSVEPVDRGNHTVWPLLNSKDGLTAGATAMAANYTDKEFVITGTHEDQEIFYVLEGTGTALIGEEEVSVGPGSCFLVPPHTIHGIKRDEGCDGVRAFFVHAAR